MKLPFSKVLLTSIVAAGFAAHLPLQAQTQTQAQAQDKQQTNQTRQTSQAQQGRSQAQRGQIRASDLKGAEVVDTQGQNLGEISEVILNVAQGEVHAVVLDFGGILGMGEKQYAFPMSRFKPGRDDDKLVLNVDKEKLKSAEGFAKGQLPAMNDEYWSRTGGRSQAAKGGKAAGGKMSLARASDIIGKEVRDSGGQEAGEVEDLLIDRRSGQVRNVVLDVDGGGKAMVPMKSLSRGTDEKLVINMTKAQIQSASQTGTGAGSGATRSGTAAGGK